MSNAIINSSVGEAGAAILQSIREHLAESALCHAPIEEAKSALTATESSIEPDPAVPEDGHKNHADHSAVEMFRERLEAVGGRCFVVRGEGEAARTLKGIIAELRATSLPAERIASSNAPLLARLAREIVECAEVTVAPSAAELFDYDVGLTTAQAAIAETGTLVLESDSENHRLVSLVPPVHIAIVNAKDICLTIGDALKLVRSREVADMSRTITFITGPSRTADIELTLTVGVHGPRELYVIVNT